MNSTAELFADVYSDNHRVEFGGITKAKRDFNLETVVDEDPYILRRSWHNRPLWYRSPASWFSDPINADYNRFIRGITVLPGDFKRAPGLFSTMVKDLAAYYGRDRTTSRLRLQSILEWYEKEERDPYSPGLHETPEPAQHIEGWIQKHRVMKREDRKDFWRAMPPIAVHLRPKGYSEPDPHVAVESDSFVLAFLNGSAVEDTVMSAKSTSESFFAGSLMALPTRVVSGQWPARFLETTIEKAIVDREKERRDRVEPGSPHRPAKDLLLSHLPGWNHATHMFDYGRRDTALRVILEEDELMASVPTAATQLEAVPPHIEQLYRWRVAPDPVYSKFSQVSREAFKQSLSLFIKGDKVAAGDVLPPSVRVNPDPVARLEKTNLWAFYTDPETAYGEATAQHMDPFEAMQRQEAFEESGSYINVLRNHPEAQSMGMKERTRTAKNLFEHGEALDRLKEKTEQSPFAFAWHHSFAPILRQAKLLLNPSANGPLAIYHNIRHLFNYHSKKLEDTQRSFRDSNPNAPYHPTVSEALEVFRRNRRPAPSKSSTATSATKPPRQNFSQSRSYSTTTEPPPPENPASSAHQHHFAPRVPVMPSVGVKVQHPKSLFDRVEGAVMRLSDAIDAWWFKREERKAREFKETTHPMDRDYSAGSEHEVLYPPNPDRSPSRLFLEFLLLRDQALKDLEKEHDAKRRADPSYDPDKRPLAELKRERLDLNFSWLLWYGMNWFDHMDPYYGPSNLQYDPTQLPKLPETVIDWTLVPEDIALIYKILKQWDHIKDGNLPVEYYELVWLLQWHSEGYEEVELPERYEVILLQRAPEYMLPREATVAHDWLMRKEHAKGNQFKLLFTGPEPNVPELEAVEQGLVTPVGGSRAIYVVGMHDVPRSLLSSGQVLADGTHAPPVQASPSSAAPPAPAASVASTASPAKQTASDQAASEVVNSTGTAEAGTDEETRKLVRQKRATGDDVGQSMMENKRDAGEDPSKGLVIRDTSSGGTAALASFFDSLSNAVALTGFKADPSGGRSAGSRKIARDLFNYVGEIVDFQTYVRKFYPLFDVYAWERSMIHLLAEVSEDVVDQRFNLARLVANTAVYTRWIEWAVERRMRCWKLNLPMPHFLKQTSPTVRSKPATSSPSSHLVVVECCDDGWNPICDIYLGN